MSYTAIYWRHHNQLSKDFDTAKEVAQFLLDGENKGELSYEAIFDNDTNISIVTDDSGLDGLEKLL